jgi:hypothetical protein
MVNNCRMDGTNLRRVQDKFVGYSEDHTNINLGASYVTLHLVDVSLSKRVYVFQAYVFEVYILVVLLAMCNVFGDYIFVP